MKREINEFNSSLLGGQNKFALADANRRQQMGEIRDLAGLRVDVNNQIAALRERGRILESIIISPGSVLYSEIFESYFRQVKADIDVLFNELDQTEFSLANTFEILKTDLRNIEYAIGELNTQFVSRGTRIPPGSGWSIVQRDSFEGGYSRLLGRAELPFDLFKDVRTGLAKDGEINPIKADAKIETTGKKLVLPEIEDKKIGFSHASLISLPISDTAFNNDLPIFNTIDENNNTFWVYTIANSAPLITSVNGLVRQVAGALTNQNITLNLSGIKDTRKQNYYVQITDANNFSYRCLNNLDQIALNCKWDTGTKCYWGYEDYYNQSCLNSNCARLQLNSLNNGTIEDGYGNDTGIIAQFSGVYAAGQIFQVSVQPSGVIGAEITLKLDVKQPGDINWLEIDPAIDAPFNITKVQYSKPNTSGLLDITNTSIKVLDKIRLDFAPIDAGSIYLTIRQENYTYLNSIINQVDVIQNQIIKYRDNKFTLPQQEINIEALLYDYLPQSMKRAALSSVTNEPSKFEAYIYQFGIASITCGLTKYFDIAIAAAKRIRAITPQLFGIQCNLEEEINYAPEILKTNNGTIEFSIIKLNYDNNNTLINIDDFPIPYTDNNGIITERIYLKENTGSLRFNAFLVSEVNVLSLNRSLTPSEYEVINLGGVTPKTQIKILRNDINESSIVIVKYEPAGGVYLNTNKTIKIENNKQKKLSLSNLNYLVSCSNKAANRDIKYSDIYLRIILRRNNPNLYTTPSLRDYKLFISENDPGRFF